MIAIIVLLWGCTSPAARVDRVAREAGVSRTIVTGLLFDHVVYMKPGATASPQPLHVYLEHDGVPWRTRTSESPDPTPRDPVMLRLMALDPAPSVYLGRPCYFGLAHEPGCQPQMWTSGRYSEPVVASMAAALRRVLASRQTPEVVWFGYSGGGALAVLLAQRFAETRAVVTLAGNLDVAAWAAYHQYSALNDSLNPADRPALPHHVLEWHFLAENDRNVPPQIAARYFSTHPAAQSKVIAGFDHRCCWDRVWLQVLEALARALSSGDAQAPQFGSQPR